MQIEVKSRETEEVRRTWEGKERVSHNQWVLLTQGGFALSFVVSHNDPKDAYAPGFYELDPTSFSSNNGRLSVERVRLKPMKAAPPQAKGA